MKCSGIRDVTFTDRRTNTEQTIPVDRSWWECREAPAYRFDTLIEQFGEGKSDV